MRFLLDENIPLLLYKRLREADEIVEHLVLGERGLPDGTIRVRLLVESDLCLLTQDKDFLEIGPARASTIVFSRLVQRMRTSDRVDLWFDALRTVADDPSAPGSLYELDHDGLRRID